MMNNNKSELNENKYEAYTYLEKYNCKMYKIKRFNE